MSGWRQFLSVQYLELIFCVHIFIQAHRSRLLLYNFMTTYNTILHINSLLRKISKKVG